MIVIILSIILTLLDQISKILISKNIILNNSVKLIKNFFYLTNTHNTGAAFSILIGKRIIFIIVTIIIILIIINYIRKNNITKKIELIAFSLILGGSIGNLIDRIVYGYVIDFIDVKIFNYDFPVFNLADSFITIGVILLFFTLSRKERTK